MIQSGFFFASATKISFQTSCALVVLYLIRIYSNVMHIKRTSTNYNHIKLLIEMPWKSPRKSPQQYKMHQQYPNKCLRVIISMCNLKPYKYCIWSKAIQLQRTLVHVKYTHKKGWNHRQWLFDRAQLNESIYHSDGWLECCFRFFLSPLNWQQHFPRCHRFKRYYAFHVLFLI